MPDKVPAGFGELFLGIRPPIMKLRVIKRGGLIVRTTEYLSSTKVQTLRQGEIVEAINQRLLGDGIIRVEIRHQSSACYPDSIGWTTWDATDVGGSKYLEPVAEPDALTRRKFFGKWGRDNPADGHHDQSPQGVRQHLERLEQRNDVDEEWLEKKLKTLEYTLRGARKLQAQEEKNLPSKHPRLMRIEAAVEAMENLKNTYLDKLSKVMDGNKVMDRVEADLKEAIDLLPQ